jgi:hypothetical protein
MESHPTLSIKQWSTMHSLSRFGPQALRQAEPRRVLLFCPAIPISQTPIATPFHGHLLSIIDTLKTRPR